MSRWRKKGKVFSGCVVHERGLIGALLEELLDLHRQTPFAPVCVDVPKPPEGMVYGDGEPEKGIAFTVAEEAIRLLGSGFSFEVGVGRDKQWWVELCPTCVLAGLVQQSQRNSGLRNRVFPRFV